KSSRVSLILLSSNNIGFCIKHPSALNTVRVGNKLLIANSSQFIYIYQLTTSTVIFLSWFKFSYLFFFIAFNALLYLYNVHMIFGSSIIYVWNNTNTSIF